MKQAVFVLGFTVLVSIAAAQMPLPMVYDPPPKTSGLNTTQTQICLVNVVRMAMATWGASDRACTSWTLSQINRSGAADTEKLQLSQLVATQAMDFIGLWNAAPAALRRLVMRACADFANYQGDALIAQGQNCKKWAIAFRDAATTASAQPIVR